MEISIDIPKDLLYQRKPDNTRNADNDKGSNKLRLS
jgi:hypothetical protein